MVCGKEFLIYPSELNKKKKRNRNYGSYCSKECHYKSRDKKIIKICLTCKKEFYVWPSRKNAKYCSKKCSNIAHTTNKKRVCPVCNKEMYLPPYRIKNKEHNCCSPQCSGKYKQTKKIIKYCLICGKEMELTKSRVKYSGGKFCSFRCKGIYNVKHQKTKNTNIEMILKEWLSSNNIAFTFQYPTGISLVDFFILPNICLFADGDYWHNKQKEKDKRQTKQLEELGYQVIRLKGSEILKGVRPTEIL